jgi:flagellar assembly factor FliW
MNHQVSVAGNAGMSELPLMETIQSRFGEISVDLSKAIAFPKGLLGLPDKSNYILANFPSEKMQQFKILQSLDESALAFIALPLEIHNAILSLDDIRAACNELQIAEANLAMLLIVSVHRSPGQVKLSVNARAPLLVDVERRVGIQHVFQSDSYKVQHMLS